MVLIIMLLNILATKKGCKALCTVRDFWVRFPQLACALHLFGNFFGYKKTTLAGKNKNSGKGVARATPRLII
jgi:hypothetical protein